MREWMYRSMFSWLTSAIVGGEWSASRSCRFTPGQRSAGFHWSGGLVDPRTGLDEMEKWILLTLLDLELQTLDRPARSQLIFQTKLYIYIYIYIYIYTYIHTHNFFLEYTYIWPPLWSSGQSFWLQNRRPGFASRHYQKKISGSGTGSTQPREYNWGATW
jgi:hypothetical protein